MTSLQCAPSLLSGSGLMHYTACVHTHTHTHTHIHTHTHTHTDTHTHTHTHTVWLMLKYARTRTARINDDGNECHSMSVLKVSLVYVRAALRPLNLSTHFKCVEIFGVFLFSKGRAGLQ